MAEQEFSGPAAFLPIPRNAGVLCVMSDVREDLLWHFVDVDGLGPRAAAKRTDAALRIDPPEWRRAMAWLRRETQRQQRLEQHVLNLAREALKTPLSANELALIARLA